jgi:phage FluMu protein Com
MSNARCNFCGRLYSNLTPSSVHDNKICIKCDKEFNSVFDKITKRYDGALKKLAER